ncbi:hypothetical protein [Desulfobacula sp.]
MKRKMMIDTITFRPSLLSTIKFFLFFTCLLSLLLYFWSTLGSWVYLALAVIPLLGIIAFGKPLIFLQQVVIGEDKTITIRYWFGKGHTEKILTALYEIAVKDDEIRSYRFNIQGNLFQVSPCVYERGEELETILKPFLKEKQISVKPAHFG